MNKLEPETGGRWLVTTQRSQHLWDLDEMTYTRLPGDGSQSFGFDGEPMKLTKVIQAPEVGNVSVIYYDDPRFPELYEQFRISSLIKSIEPYDDL
jgi:hypothetical protein